MNKFRLYFILPMLALMVFSCKDKGDEDFVPEPIRPFAIQYSLDEATIETYLKSHYIESVVDHPGFNDDQDVVITQIASGNTTAVSIFNDPRLEHKDVEVASVVYRIYYLPFREGNISEKPTSVDAIQPSYRGSFLAGADGSSVSATQFEYLQFPQSFFPLQGVIRGWAEIFPLFGTGTVDTTPSPDPANFENFGAGVMFIPSGLAYYNGPPPGSGIPKYSPLMFTFKLYSLQRLDQDGDGVPSYLEDINGNGIFTDDDSDGDGIQDYLDTDDDGDGYLTKDEFTDKERDELNNITTTTYTFENIPDCAGNQDNPARNKRYLDKNCHQKRLAN